MIASAAAFWHNLAYGYIIRFAVTLSPNTCPA